MKAIILEEFGGVKNLTIREVPQPEPGDHEVLIKVESISINPVDVQTRAGKGVASMLKGINPIILGWDISGIVVGSNNDRFKSGEEVFGMINFPGHGKAYAEFVAAPTEQLALKPANVSHGEASAATLAALTAYQNLVEYGEVKKGQRVLINGASGGVGHYAVQIAKQLGAYVIGTASATNKDFVIGLGADEHIDYKSQKFEDILSDIDFVLDTVGRDNTNESIKVTKAGGTVICIPSDISEDNKKNAKEKDIKILHTMVKSSGTDMAQIAGLLKDGSLKSKLYRSFAFDQMGEAHLLLESGKTTGKIVVSVNGD